MKHFTKAHFSKRLLGEAGELGKESAVESLCGGDGEKFEPSSHLSCFSNDNTSESSNVHTFLFLSLVFLVDDTMGIK